MQTFLPDPDFTESLRMIDKQRLGKQRVEAYQILRVLMFPDQAKGWKRHPAVLMWTGHVDALKLYYNLSLLEWRGRGCMNRMLMYPSGTEPEMPWWMGRPEFHLAHQSNLVRKAPDFYGPLFPGVPPDIPYWWPTEHEDDRPDASAKWCDRRA